MASTLHDGDESPSWNSKQEWKQIETPLLTSQLALISHSWSHFKPRSNATESASLTSPQIPEAQFSFSNISMSLPESSLWISTFPNKLPEDSESEHPKSQPTTSNFWPPFANLFKFPYIMSQTQGPKHQSQRDKGTGTRTPTMDDDGYIETLCQNPRHLSPTRPHPRKPSNTKISTSSNSMHRVEDIFQPGSRNGKAFLECWACKWEFEIRPIPAFIFELGLNSRELSTKP